VIAIIAILAAILFPVFAQAREQGRKAVCLSNVKQSALAIRMYTQDYDEGYPNTGDPYLFAGKRWRWCVMPYLGIGQKEKANFNAEGTPSILICPSDTVSGQKFDSTSYGYSAAFYHTPEQTNQMHFGDLLNNAGGFLPVTQTEAAVGYPAQKALVGEWLNSHQFGSGGRVGYWGIGYVKPATPGAHRWEGGRVYALADGHAKFVQAGRIHLSADDCPDIHLTVDGIAGRDID